MAKQPQASWTDVLKGATSDLAAVKAVKAAIMVQLIMIPIRLAIKGIIGK